MNSKLLLTLAFVFMIASVTAGSWGNSTSGFSYITLNSPANGANTLLNYIGFNISFNMSGTNYLKNVTFYDNSSGTFISTFSFIATNFSSTHGETLGSIHAGLPVSTLRGMVITPKENLLINNITRRDDRDGNYTYIFKSDKTLIASGIFNGTDLYSIFPDTVLEKDVPYWILTNGSSVYFETTPSSMPIDTTYITWNGSFIGPITNNLTINDSAYSILRVGYSRIQNKTITFNRPYYEVKNILWNVLGCDTGNGCGFSSSNYTFKTDILLGICNSTNNIKYLNITFKDQVTLATLNSTLNTAQSTYYAPNINGSSKSLMTYYGTSELKSYAFCFIPPSERLSFSSRLSISSTGYPTRNIAIDFSNLTNSTTNYTLYLLDSSSGSYSTFQVLNSAGQTLQNTYINASTTIDGSTVVDNSGYTDGSGLLTFFLNPNALYTIYAEYPGYAPYTAQITPTQSQYTIYLTGSNSTTDLNNYTTSRAVNGPYILPSNIDLFNNTNYHINMTINSSYWAMTSWGYIITSSNGTVLDTKTSTVGTGGTLDSLINTANYTSISMSWYYLTNGIYTNDTVYFNVINTEEAGWSITSFFTDFKKAACPPSGDCSKTSTTPGIFGLNSFGLSIIVFIIIFVTSGLLTYKFGISSPAAIMGVIFGMTAFFDIGAGLIYSPLPDAVPHAATWFLGIILVGLFIREAMQ